MSALELVSVHKSEETKRTVVKRREQEMVDVQASIPTQTKRQGEVGRVGAQWSSLQFTRCQCLLDYNENGWAGVLGLK